MLRNVVRHHAGTKPKSREVRQERSAAKEYVNSICMKAHGEIPSYVETQHFLDAFYNERQREVLIPKVSELLEHGWNLREVRGHLDTEEGEWF
jgi:hypothetical protein